MNNYKWCASGHLWGEREEGEKGYIIYLSSLINVSAFFFYFLGVVS